MGVIRVLVAEDQALIRQSFAQLIDAHPQMKVIGAVGDGAEAVRLASGSNVVVMDIRMPVMDGIEATRQIVRGASSGGATHASAPKVLVLTTFREEDLVLGALEAGAAGFLLKDSDPRELLSAIMRIHRGEGVIDPKVTPMVLRHVSPRTTLFEQPASASSAGGPSSDTTDAGTQFTPREQEILDLVCQGLSNDEIARRLVVATTTVKTHVKALLTKTGSRSRVDLVIWAAKNGLL
ncbi:response regulator transcription factor [Corynebacterium amycolatum]|uniref:response regulator n=1 Tax=Corynebacterium amycolatum TaxID=43765 RepID=UPI00211A08B2|nr:response regulator transcription factor [Corynebacterium amycolatum]MCQ9126196.1 response regulator transcription factor [Corynebacterium amycolatum]MCQ9170267.1 response regulator transcription factor [Corynebacterium amycolatum]MCQ9175323.1 response regulator transcription factor [Corynebacterium amycolatum]